MKHKLFFFITMSSVLFTQNLHSQLKSEDVNRIIDKAREKFDLPAIAVVTLNSEAIITSNIQGVRIYKTSSNATINDLFHIGSCSKSVLAFIAGKLTEEGKIQWRTQFFDLFPELKEIAKPEYLFITLEDLLLCKAGIKAYTSGTETFPHVDSADAKYSFAKYLVQQAPVSKLNNGIFDFLYSNAGYTIAALMLEKVSGTSYEELINKYLVSELGINTYIGFPNTLNKEQPWGHLINEDSFDIFPPDHPYRLNNLIMPSGDLSMTPLGFAQFIQLNLKGLRGKDNFISSKTYQHIHHGFQGFSLGVANGKLAGHRYSGMDGSAGTFFCRSILVPEADFAFTIMTNAGSGKAQMKAVEWITMKITKKRFNWWWKFWL